MFENKVALVVGAGTGIGAATAKLLAKQGAAVVVAGPEPGPVAETVRQIQEDGGSATGMACDVSDRDSVSRLFDELLAQHQRLDVVVNSAGIFAMTSVFEPDYERVDALIAVNLVGAMNVTFGAIAAMRSTGGVLVCVTSTEGVLASPAEPVYAATKAGLGHFIASIAPQLRGAGIRVVGLAPGAVRTAMNADMRNSTDPAMVGIMSGLDAKSTGAYGSFWMDPEEIAPAIVFLASDGARGIHGTNVICDQALSSAHGDL
jgi:NAD(P)-dependent dehydrogenase (short-subunit alcohol dehydrogenase family)